jgi:hypothetical protein
MNTRVKHGNRQSSLLDWQPVHAQALSAVERERLTHLIAELLLSVAVNTTGTRMLPLEVSDEDQ